MLVDWKVPYQYVKFWYADVCSGAVKFTDKKTVAEHDKKLLSEINFAWNQLDHDTANTNTNLSGKLVNANFINDSLKPGWSLNVKMCLVLVFL